MGYGYLFEVEIKNTSSIFPYLAKKDSFINLLKQFSETKRPSIQNNADVVFMLDYSYGKYTIEAIDKHPMSKEKLGIQMTEQKIIKDLWFIAKGKNIDDEKDFENEVLDPKNHKQK